MKPIAQLSQLSGDPTQDAQFKSQVLHIRLSAASTTTVPVGHEQDPSSLVLALSAHSKHLSYPYLIPHSSHPDPQGLH